MTETKKAAPEVASIGSDDVFVDVPEEIDATWRHGALVGGMTDLAMRQPGALARAFKRAGDTLIAAALDDDAAHDVVHPVLFSYRHSIELYLKAIAGSAPRTHDLGVLIEKFRRAVAEQLGAEVPPWVVARLSEFDDIDGGSTAFRYPENGVLLKSGKVDGEIWVDFARLKDVMDRLEGVFARVMQALAKLKA